ncbi:MAG: hypothetical protein GX879_00470 [Bacteroidales bacterium]|nr:hypothetical protein [Bacteroidales bacterium]
MEKEKLEIVDVTIKIQAYGYYSVFLKVNGWLKSYSGNEELVSEKILYCRSDNSLAVYVYLDEDYDLINSNGERPYPTRYHAGVSLINEVLYKNWIELDYKFNLVPSPKEVAIMRLDSGV